jgi:hypothetical protein
MMKGIVLRPPFLLAVALGRASSMAETSMLAQDGGSKATTLCTSYKMGD